GPVKMRTFTSSNLKISAVVGRVVPVFSKASAYGGNVAIMDHSGSHTYRSLYKNSKSLAGLITKALTCQSGDLQGKRISFLCATDASYTVAQWAAWMCGSIAVPLYRKHPPGELEYVISDSQSSLLVAGQPFMDSLEPLAQKLGLSCLQLPTTSGLNTLKSEDTQMLPEENISDWAERPAMLIYTSSTTGRPKGVLHTHSSLQAIVQGLVSEWFNAQRVWEQLFVQYFIRAVYNKLYLMKMPVCVFQGAVGVPLPGMEVRIMMTNTVKTIIAEGNSKGTCKGKEGELLVRGSSVLQKKYWNKPQETADTFTEDGWFKTGDTALYRHGMYWIMGHTSVDIIKSGGYKISALDVERHLLAHPDITDVAVISAPDPTWGQKVTAVVQLKKGKTMSQLKTWAREHMATYTIPTGLILVEEMPRNQMGKVNKKDLLRQFSPTRSG
uniref:Acyl-CoA synthetase family member 3 n=1 Tax=Cyprinus carpio carpio TaxID=630221 RepID=A0A9J8BIS3_CYPCA